MLDASMTVSMIQPFRFSPAERAPLRIGILLDSPKLSGFFAKIIGDIQESNFATINILAGEILTAARYGVWSYHHGDNDFYRGGPPHFWELCERAPLSGVILQVLTEELDGGVVLCKSLFATQPTVMVSRNRFAPYWGSTDLVIRK